MPYSRSINKVTLRGNLVADPELRYTGDGTPVINARIATNSYYKTDGSDEWQSKAEYHTVVQFGEDAERVAANVSMGQQVHVEGSLRTRKWEDQDGNDRYSTEIKAYRIDWDYSYEGSDPAVGGDKVMAEDEPFEPDDELPF